MPPPPPPVMPVPSSFALAWAEAQEGPDAILCLRPPEKQGLPLITLHEAFLHFVNESKKALPATEVDAFKAAFQLCDAMARHHDNEIARGVAFNKALDPFISQDLWLPEITMSGGPGMSGRLDGALQTEPGVLPLLREDRGELGTNGDPYMQLSRVFQVFVKWKESEEQEMIGVAKFLLIVAGTCRMYLMCFLGL
jgi:hypothetical protein